MQTIVAGVEATEVVPGRTEYIDLQQNFQVLVDSANTPGALNRLLEDVRLCGARKILLVFGCEGEEDKAKRPYMGEIAHYKVSPQSAQSFTSFAHTSRGVCSGHAVLSCRVCALYYSLHEAVSVAMASASCIRCYTSTRCLSKQDRGHASYCLPSAGMQIQSINCTTAGDGLSTC